MLLLSTDRCASREPGSLTESGNVEDTLSQFVNNLNKVNAISLTDRWTIMYKFSDLLEKRWSTFVMNCSPQRLTP
jgi:hypothetical protein